MIINANGTVKARTSSQVDELDSNGYPILNKNLWSNAIECNIQTNNQANVGITANGNVFDTASFEVTIEEQSFNAEVVQLFRDGEDLGVFQVQGRPELLSAVGNIKFFVKCLSNV